MSISLFSRSSSKSLVESPRDQAVTDTRTDEALPVHTYDDPKKGLLNSMCRGRQMR